jgi:hypothetical protein
VMGALFEILIRPHELWPFQDVKSVSTSIHVGDKFEGHRNELSHKCSYVYPLQYMMLNHSISFNRQSNCIIAAAKIQKHLRKSED